MPRSGTSLVMRMLWAGGMPVLADGLRAADEHNPLGYFEYEPVKRLPKDASWVADAKGKAVKVIYRLLEYLPDGIEYCVLFIERDLREVFASQRHMLRARGDAAAGQDEELMLAALAAEGARVKEWMAKQKNVRVLVIPHEGVLRDPRGWAQAMTEFLGRELDCEAMAGEVDLGLYRHRAG